MGTAWRPLKWRAVTHLKKLLEAYCLHCCYHHYPQETFFVDLVPLLMSTMQNMQQSWCQPSSCLCSGWFSVPTVCKHGWVYILIGHHNWPMAVCCWADLGHSFTQLCLGICGWSPCARLCLGCYLWAGGNTVLIQAVWVTARIFLECTSCVSMIRQLSTCKHGWWIDEFVCCVKSYLYSHVRVTCWAPVTKP